MNPYNVLEINENATMDDIKKAYKKLSLKYHPDKNNQVDEDKIKHINNAYELLSCKNRKIKYDNMQTKEKSYFNNIMLNLVKTIKSSKFYKNSAFFFLHNYNSINKIKNKKYTNIYDYIINNMDDYLSTITKDTIININVTIMDRYLEKYKKLDLKYLDESLYVPLVDEELVFKNKGLFNNLIVNVLTNEDSKYMIIDSYNLYMEQEISLYKYVKGGIIDVKHMNESLKLNIEPNAENMTHILENKGLPYYNNKIRGKLYIKLKIMSLTKKQEKILYENFN